MPTRQYGLLKCHSCATEAFSVNWLCSLPVFAACFLELNDVMMMGATFHKRVLQGIEIFLR